MADIKKFDEKEGGFKKFLWNSDTGEFLGRTGSSWFKITVFYIIFFTGLAAFFSLMLWIFLKTLDPNRPKYMGIDGLIGDNPGVGFRPMPDQDKNVESTLIWYRRGSKDSAAHWINELTKTLQKYENKGEAGDQGMTCKSGDRAGEGKWCQMEINKINSECSQNRDFGYTFGNPCIMIKLNRIFGWKPDPITAKDTKELAEMPMDLQKIVQNATEEHVWFSCEGENAADRENLGSLDYYPQQGIPVKFFPYLKQIGYQSPFIFVRLANPTPNVLINIECKAWAKNIKPSRMDRVGTVHFEVMID